MTRTREGKEEGDDDGYYNLGQFHRPISSRSKDAQKWFDRGIVWSMGFNHEEASKCFQRALSYDPNCAIAYWGLAYTLGPNYNKPWNLFGRKERDATLERAQKAVDLAVQHAESATGVEMALIEAVTKRYPRDQEPTRLNCSLWNREYADAMARAHAAFPDDLDVSTLYADAMMNLTPWALWDETTGEPASGARTLETKRVLDAALARPSGQRHPGVLHLYIHLMEMSAHPEAALPAADRLRTLVPDAGHLNHMPSHIDVLVGDYGRAVQANRAAIEADSKFLAREGPMNFYTLYRCHDFHFLLYAAMLAGQRRAAIDSVARLEATITEDLLRVGIPPMADWLESFLAMRVHAYVRFGMWEEIITLPLPSDPALYCVTTALVHYAKGMALAATSRVAEAERHRSLFRAAAPKVQSSRTLFNNKCVDILVVAEALLDGELEYRRGNYEIAFAHLREAVVRCDGLPFDEPWGWMQPPRHAYGALLLEQGHVADAASVYAADLGLDGDPGRSRRPSLPRSHQHPNNVWALHGYHECLQKLGRREDALKIQPALNRALKDADIPIKASCYCRTSVINTEDAKL